MSPDLPLRIGTRGSPLALAQARTLQRHLAAADPRLAAPEATAIVKIVTSGDREQDRRLAEIGGKGLFTKEIDGALLAGEVRLAVHSLKDLPTQLPDGIVIACIPEREDVRDAFISNKATSLDGLPAGAVVGTVSLRRAAQLLHRRPDLRIVPLRGNVETRLRKLDAGEVDATVLALAGLRRLGVERRAIPVAVEEMLPAVGQAAIAVTCRDGDAELLTLLQTIDHRPSHRAILAERAFLAVLDGSCRTPIAGLAETSGDSMRLRGLVATPDGRELLTASGEGAEPEALGRAVANDLLSRCGPAFLAAAGRRS